jgi:hypothetical protein
MGLLNASEIEGEPHHTTDLTRNEVDIGDIELQLRGSGGNLAMSRHMRNL